ncbi:MAG: glycine hydroxymethyltransferase, partial [Chitinivibrionales bacterium]
FAEYVDKGCPMVIGGPLAHVMAAKLVTLKEANTPEFREYAERVIENASTLASACVDKGMRIATGGTDNHLFLLDVRPQGLTGRQAESALRECGITLNRNSLPADPNGPWYTSGLRFGTAALTSLGMDKKDMEKIASVIEKVIKNMKPSIIESGKNKGKQSRAKYTIDQNIIEEAKKEVKEIMEAKPLYPELDLEFLEKHFG